MQKTFCDSCGKELTRNVVSEPLIVKTGDYTIAVSVTTDGGGDLCLDCLLKMLTETPKKPRADKGQPHRSRKKPTMAETLKEIGNIPVGGGKRLVDILPDPPTEPPPKCPDCHVAMVFDTDRWSCPTGCDYYEKEVT